jgi:SepF-like predicted cell division protein (DUF552 family)
MGIGQPNGYILEEIHLVDYIAFFHKLTKFYYVYIINVKGKQELVYGHRRHSAGTILIIDQNTYERPC